jgi:AraC-like DNA-binding protein
VPVLMVSQWRARARLVGHAPARPPRHGISARYLRELFEDKEMTYSRFVLDRRLALAYRALRQPQSATRTISSIANDTGFGYLSYFNRTFRRLYGITPSGAPGKSTGDHSTAITGFNTDVMTRFGLPRTLPEAD